MSSLLGCCVGEKLNDKCHQLSYCKETGLLNFNDFDEDDKELLILRTQLKEISTICLHHRKVYLEKYVVYQKKCCDPFSYHKKTVKGENYYILIN